MPFTIHEISQALSSVVEEMVQREPLTAHQPFVEIRPTTAKSIGIRGLIGLSNETGRELYGRRIEADVIVTAREEDADTLRNEVTRVHSQLWGASRIELAQSGILKLLPSKDGLGEVATQTGPPPRFTQKITFHILFEYIDTPTEADEMISEIPINLGSGPT